MADIPLSIFFNVYLFICKIIGGHTFCLVEAMEMYRLHLNCCIDVYKLSLKPGTGLLYIMQLNY